MNIQSYRQTVRENKRAAILSAALKVFTSSSFASASMVNIAEKADVSTATLYKHFESKDELFSEIAIAYMAPFNRAWTEFVPDSECSKEPLQSIIDLSQSFAELLLNEQTLSLFRLIIAEGERFPELKEVVYRHGRDPIKAQLTEILRAYSERGIIDIAEPAAASEFYIGMLTYWLLFSPIFNTDIKFSREQIAHIIRESALMLLARFDAKSGSIVEACDKGASLRNGLPRTLRPSMDSLGQEISA